jgi:hypothetical protein
LQREQLTGLRIELDYLTVGHSNVLKLIYRIHNQTTANRRLEIGWLCFWQPGGDSERNVLYSEDIQRKHTPWESWPEAGHWGAVVNPDSGRAAIVVSPHPAARLFDWGEAGGHLGWTLRVDVGPLAVTEHVCYLVVCSDLAEARRYTWLKS